MQQLEIKAQRAELKKQIKINLIILLIFAIPMIIGLVWGIIQLALGNVPKNNSLAQNISEQVFGGALLGMLWPVLLLCQAFFWLTGANQPAPLAAMFAILLGAPCAGVAALINAVGAGRRRKQYCDNLELRRMGRLNFYLALAPLVLAFGLLVAMFVLRLIIW